MSTEQNGEPDYSKKMDAFTGLDPEIKQRTRKMMMWFMILAILMLFAGVTSAIIVLNGKLIWLHMAVPVELIVSNILIVISSITLIGALVMLKKGKQKMGLLLYATTLVLGIAFAFSQNAAWNAMSDKGLGYTITKNDQGLNAYHWNTLGKTQGVYGTDYWFEMSGERLIFENGEYYKPSDPSGPVTNTVMTTFNAFGAMLSILIYLHVIHFIFGLIYLAINTIRIIKGKINQNNTLSIHVSGMYWHFMGILWLYLFVFLFFIY